MAIFQPFRALGLITDGRAWSYQRRGLEAFVTLSVGHAWQIFNCARLQLVFVGPQLDSQIQSLASSRDYTYAATGRSIGVFRRAHLVQEWDAHESKIQFLLAFGHHLLSVDSGGQVFIWATTKIDDQDAPAEPVGRFTLRPNFTPTCIVHPETYLNKVLLGSEEGSLQLWNICTEKLVYEFKGWQTPIRCCVSSPALDVVGIGCADGRLHLHNLKYDETIVTFTHTVKGPITAISFRTDGHPHVAAGGVSGAVSIWNLNKRKLQTVIRDAHDAEIMGLQYLDNEPVLLSVGNDNSIKMWIFDSSDGEGCLLRFRSGHSAPPTCIGYYGNGRLILSAGQDRAFRVFSTVQDHQSRELSQGHLAKRAKILSVKEEDLKLPPVVAFAAAEVREREWCNVVTCHDGSNSAFSWRLQNFVIGEHVLMLSSQPQSPVKACAISACGNFAVLGTEAGCIERFNLQSGLSRGSYQDGTESGSVAAHNGAVTGIACDAANVHLISGSYDASIKIWDFKAHTLKSALHIGSPISKLVLHRGNGLVAAASDDMVIRVFDVVALRLVRQFAGYTDRITDLAFSEDGKWLISSSMDGTVRIWDVVGSKQLDAMRVDAAVTALSLSPGMDMLATAHVNKNGIYLWANRLMYGGVSNTDQQGSRTVVHVSLPSSSAARDENINEGVVPVVLSSLLTIDSETKRNPTKPDFSKVQIMPELVTMAILPRHQWLGLVNLDAIKDRNKPLAPPEEAEKAPFFLPPLLSVPSTPQLQGPTLDSAGPKRKHKDDGISDCFDERRVSKESRLRRLLLDSAKQENYDGLLSYMKTLSVPAVEFELRMLNSVDPLLEEAGDQSPELTAMLDFFIEEVVTNNNFELLQGWIRLFLKVYGESINQNNFLQEKARKLSTLQSSVWMKLDGLFQHVRCMISFVSQVQR